MAAEPLEDWYDGQVRRFKNHGTFTFMGIEAKYSLERAKKIYEEELRYHSLNPSNKSSALDVKRAKENLDFLQDRYNAYHGTKTYLLNLIKLAASQSDEGGSIDVQGGMILEAWRSCYTAIQFKRFFEASDLNVISFISPNEENVYVAPDGDKNATIRILDENDIYEATWAGHCRKLSDEEMELFREEKRHRERIAAETAREEAKSNMSNSWISQNGYWLGGVLMIGCAILFIGAVILQR